MPELPRILKLSQIAPGVTRVYFTSGEVREVEWKQFARPGTVLERLADPDYASRCRRADGGYAVRWPDGLDWSAESVLEAGEVVMITSQPNSAARGPRTHAR